MEEERRPRSSFFQLTGEVYAEEASFINLFVGIGST